MRKLAFLALGCLVSSAAFASVTLSTAPQTPIVITADLTYQGDTGPVTVQGPWFRVQYQIATDQVITVVGIQEIVTAQDGSTTSYYLRFSGPIEIAANSTFKTDSQYLGSLQQQNGLAYKVTARLIGWVGSSSASGPLLNSILNFSTQ